MGVRGRALWPALLFVALSSGWARGQTDGAARRIFDLTNQDRQAHGLQPLRWSQSLAAAAAAHAQWMAREAGLSHQYPGEPELTDRAAHAGAHFQAIAENIAMGPDPESINDQWMHSPGHRRNILDPRMNALGVAVVERGGSLDAVEDFAEASEVLTLSQTEQRVRELLRQHDLDPSGPSGEAEEACRSARGVPGGAAARAVVRFETPDLTQLPAQVAAEIRNGGFKKAAVGACSPQGNQGSFTVYRVAILFY